MLPIAFVADLHLSDDTPDLTALFGQFLRQNQGKFGALYILGDLFEAWTGDDDDSATAQQIAQNLHAFSQTAPVYFIAGNRDFLLGNDYATKANMTILPENYPIEYFGQKILLTHGDEMCTQDVSYLRYRRVMRQTWLQAILLRLPFATRKQIAANIRAKSRAKKQCADNYAIADVTETGVQAALRRFPDTQIIIHGHTHRPNTHHHTFNGRDVTRYVLADWHDNTGGYLLLDTHGAQMRKLPENPL